MIVRTYKRRSRRELLGSQGGTGDGDNELGFPGPRTFAAFSQEDRYDEPDSPSWSPLQQDRRSFSQPSSSGVDDADIFQFSSLPTQRPQFPQELGKSSRTLIPTAADPHIGKCGRSISAGQKLIRAESLLKKAKASSSLNFKARDFGFIRTSGHVKSTGGDDQVQARPVNCAIESGDFKAGATDFVVDGSLEQATEKSTFASGNCHMVARVTSSLEGGEMKAMVVSPQILNIIGPCAPPTSTLLEAQESGEMMEHVDEANFAMDGLRPGQPLRICRASLISLLSIFGSRQRRRLLRTHGMVKPVLDAVLTVPTDDSATALGAAALLYVTAYDGQDEEFLDSPECIHFLMKLLDPACSVHDKKLSLLGSRLLALGSHSKSNKVEAHSSVLDQGGLLLVNKVKHLLYTMKGQSDGILKFDNQSVSFPAEVLSSEWLVLLTLEKACLSTVVLEDNAGSVRRVGGYFKERLRELGGLNAVCELAASCFSTLRKLKSKMDYQLQNTLIKGSRGAGVLLRCLRVLENVTFLSENNQKFLLDVILSKNGTELPSTFLEVIVGIINLISDFICSRSCMEQTSHGVQVQKSPNVQALSLLDKVSFQSGRKASGAAGNDKSTLLGLSLESCKVKGSFDFDDLDWSRKTDFECKQVLKKQKCQTFTKRETCKVSSAQIISSENVDMNLQTRETRDNLLEDCLVSAVKVLMNLTNDNDLGCRQVAVVGGLDAMASLIVKHFPSFHSFPLNVEGRNGECKANEKFTKAEYQDQDLDLLVVVLGVLVNLVEKDTKNRGRLISLNTESFYDALNGTLTRREHSIIQLLCSIFLSKEGAGRAIESSKGNSEIDTEKSFKEGQKEAEDMILEAYSALLLAFLSKESSTVRSAIAQHLPEGSLSALVPVLERFLAFHLSLNMLSSETHETVRDVIESCK